MSSTWPWLSVSQDEFFLLWWAANLGEPPTVLDIPHLGATPDERAGHAESASELLSARGLGTVAEPTPDLTLLLRDIRDATVTVDLRGYGAHGAHRVLGALDGTDAVVAARTGDRITLGRTSRAALVEAMIGELAPLGAGPGGAANVTTTDFHRACEAGVLDGAPGFVRVLHAAGVRSGDASTLAMAFDGRECGGQLGVTVRQPGVRKVRVPGPVTWLDTPAGRYALRQRGGWVSATPATVRRLVSMAEDLLSDVCPAGAPLTG